MTRSPFVVPLAEVLAVPGRQQPLARAGHVPGIALSTTRVPDDADVTLDATIEAQGQTIIVQGVARAPWEGECRRCLEPVSGELEVDLREVFEPHPVEGETFPTDGEEIDLEPMLRETLALALPLAPLCRDDCAGPNPDADPVVPEAEGVTDGDDPSTGDAEPARDPRWAALDQLRFDR
jgi:uncharacterized protein